MHNSRLLLLAFSVPVALGPAPQEVRIELREGLVYRMQERASSVGVCTGTFLIDGEEYELDEEFLESMGGDEVLEISMRDEVLEVEDGRAVRVTREYTRLEQRSVEGGEEVKRSGILLGEPLELTLDEEGALLVGVIDGEQDVEEKFLVDHNLHEFFEPLLPRAAVTEGESWKLDEEAALEFSITHDPLYFELPEELEPDPALVEAIRAEAECEVEVTFDGVVEREGVECLLLSYECTIDCELDELPEDPVADEDFELEADLAFQMVFSGQLWIDAEERFPLAMEVTAEGLDSSELGWTEEGSQMQMDLAIDIEVSVEIEWELIERGK
jgi:hypothetical protein